MGNIQGLRRSVGELERKKTASGRCLCVIYGNIFSVFVFFSAWKARLESQKFVRSELPFWLICVYSIVYRGRFS